MSTISTIYPAPLGHLSLVHASEGVPPTPSNADRARALLDALPVELGNGYPWPHLAEAEGRQYALDEMADAQDRATDPEFSFMYGGRK